LRLPAEMEGLQPGFPGSQERVVSRLPHKAVGSVRGAPFEPAEYGRATSASDLAAVSEGLGVSAPSSLEDYAHALERRLVEKSALVEELARVHKSLEARLLKLDDGLSLKDEQIASLARQYDEAHRTGLEWRDRAVRLDEEMGVLRRAVLERDDEIESLRQRLEGRPAPAPGRGSAPTPASWDTEARDHKPLRVGGEPAGAAAAVAAAPPVRASPVGMGGDGPSDGSPRVSPARPERPGSTRKV